VAKKSWRCFHCDEVFTGQREAATHFGDDCTDEPGCKLRMPSGELTLLRHIRKQDRELRRFRAEDSDVLRMMYGQSADHRQALIREEEGGFARGVRDTSNLVDTLFGAIKHGDEEHQAWLREAINCHFDGRPVPAPRGLGRTALGDRTEAKRD
jgi:diadenosine tetraphosphatase ApaH/serine/threonine PP2A family protein phosphatase